ncbi:MAG: DMT family transporter [Alphaproteobacteria bacterium]|nr:MAG: DMT family transporter [Alphaproteobacteria bacterium]
MSRTAGHATADTAPHNTLLAAAWMLGAIVCFTSMAVAGRAVSAELDTFEIMLYRSVIGVAIVVLVALRLGRTGEFATRRIGLHALRNVSHFAGQNLWFFAITVAPLTQVFALEFTTPIWAMLFAPLVLGERLTPVRVLSAGLGFIGVLIVTRPDVSAPGIGLIAAAGAALGFAGSALFTRLLTRSETILTIMFWLTGMQAVFGLVCAGFDGDIAWPSTAAWPGVAVIALAGLLAHSCLTKALSMAPAAVIMPVDFARLPLVGLVGMALYGEPLDIWVFVGGAVIFAANYINIRAESRLSPRG